MMSEGERWFDLTWFIYSWPNISADPPGRIQNGYILKTIQIIYTLNFLTWRTSNILIVNYKILASA